MKLLWQQIASTTITEILCNSKLDGVVLDLEHGCFSNTDIYQSIQIATLMKKKVFVRLTCVDENLIRMTLDAGVDGIIMSTVESETELVRLQNLCCYKNKNNLFTQNGQRGRGLVRENMWGKKPFKFRVPMIIPQIETVKGVERIEQIKEVCLGPVLVGPYDLSASCGDVGNFESPSFKKSMSKLKEVMGSDLGYHIVKDADKQIEGLKGSKFLAFGLDTLFLLDGISSIEGILK
jgi:2-dehydro-3-deoxyglucarate aldolase